MLSVASIPEGEKLLDITKMLKNIAIISITLYNAKWICKKNLQIDKVDIKE